VLVGKPSIDCSRLLTKSNVRMLGYKPYTQIPHYGKCFDVAVMPWRQNDWIEACNPIKLKEYLALGKPIVSTPFKELERYDGLVYPASKPEEFVRCIHQALRENDAQRIEARRNKVKTATWRHKAKLLSEMFFRQPTTEIDRRENYADSYTLNQSERAEHRHQRHAHVRST
jgi:glycosyltransferase involved in cell wall biosynthesis